MQDKREKNYENKICKKQGNATVTATGESGSAIYSYGSDITVSGGIVTATGKSGRAIDNTVGELTVSGGTVIATGEGSEAITNCKTGTVTTPENCIIIGAVIGVTDTNITGDRVYGTATLTTDATISVGKTLIIPSGATLIIADGVTLTNKGTIDLSGGGTLSNKDKVNNIGDGTIKDAAEVTGVILDKTVLSFYSNTGIKTAALTATVSPADATNRVVTWASSDNTVATVINGNVTAVGNGTAAITVTTVDGGKTATCGVTVSTYTIPPSPPSSSSSSSGGGSSNSTPIVTPPPIQPTTQPTNLEQVEVKVETTLDTNGNVTVNVKSKDITDAIANAKTTANGIIIVLNANGSKTANSVNINLTAEVQKTIISNKIVDTIVVVDNPNIKIGMDLSTIKEINAQTQSTVNLTATRMDSGNLTGNAKTAIGTRPAFDLKINYGSSKKFTNTTFTDVSATAYYAPYVAWATEENITTSTTATTFAPDQIITRQEIAVFMENYAKVMNYSATITREAIIFTDSVDIASWTSEAVRSMQQSGVIMGKDGNRFDPTGVATRAEASAIMRRYMELIIDTQTAQGWETNDNGAALYYQDGKLLTGNKTVGGKAYNFNNFGETAFLAEVTNKKQILHTVKKNEYFGAIAKQYGCTVAELMALNSKKYGDVIHPDDVLKVPQK